tara:strand:+ start:2413 stop:2697 length:285 start_codon:yes stop_codon:yes gene_type:complete
MEKDKLIKEALANVRDDRKETQNLLKELKYELSSGEATHARAGVVAAKYVETLQRSNEQLVKIIAQLKKEKEPANLSFSKDEKESIFEIIQESA